MTDENFPVPFPVDDQLVPAFEAAWQLLDDGARQRKSAAHTPVLATVDRDGAPDQRVLVLRKAERQLARLRFHTDARSPKIEAIGAGTKAHVLFYDPVTAQQLRLGGTAVALTAGHEVEAAWAESTAFARRCYLTTAAPGSATEQAASGLPEGVAGREPTEDELVPARLNFALIHFTILSIDWLHLANSGHRRALFRHPDAQTPWQGRWLIP